MPKTRRETKCDNESVEATTKNQKPGLYKIQQWFLLIFRPQTKVTKSNCFWEDLWGCIWTKFFIGGGIPWFAFCRSAGWPWSQQKWGWVFGFCRPESFLFKCYVFGFVAAVLVFSRNVPTKSEAPTPPGQFFWGMLLCFLCFSAFMFFLPSLFSAFPLFVFPAFLFFPAFLLVCFCAFMFSVSSAFAFPAFLFFCFYAFLLNSFTFLQSCVFAALLLAFLLLCFLSLPSLCFAFFLLCSLLFVTQMRHQRDPRHPKEILIRNPTWNPKKTLGESLNDILKTPWTTP